MNNYAYTTDQIKQWKQQWIELNGQSDGLIKQLAWNFSLKLSRDIFIRFNIKTIAIWCEKSSELVDWLALYLKQQDYHVDIYQDGAQCIKHYDGYIDAINHSEDLINLFNQQSGLKISLDVPTGLNPNTGYVATDAIRADFTLTELGYKTGLLTGQAKNYVGCIYVAELLPKDSKIVAKAQLCSKNIYLSTRKPTGHKGTYGHALIIGGSIGMGGAVIMAAEAAYAVGAGKVTVVCHKQHHIAILSRAPNVMVKDIEALSDQDKKELLESVQSISFGMGLGRDLWAQNQFQQWHRILAHHINLPIVYDADALWFLNQRVSLNVVLTPHSGEAAHLLDCSVNDVEKDRFKAIEKLQHQYGGQWVLKGAGSLILEHNQYWICTQGNAGMATGGMGDILSGMIAGFKAQNKIGLHDIVTLHAQAGDYLAKSGQHGLVAHHMPQAIYHVINAV